MISIQDMWNSEKQSVWCDQIDAYWEHVEGQKVGVLELEEEMGNLDPQLIRDLTDEEWRDFLANKYIPWKHRASIYWKDKQKKFIERYEAQEELILLYSIKNRIFVCNP